MGVRCSRKEVVFRNKEKEGNGKRLKGTILSLENREKDGENRTLTDDVYHEGKEKIRRNE